MAEEELTSNMSNVSSSIHCDSMSPNMPEIHVTHSNIVESRSTEDLVVIDREEVTGIDNPVFSFNAVSIPESAAQLENTQEAILDMTGTALEVTEEVMKRQQLLRRMSRDSSQTVGAVSLMVPDKAMGLRRFSDASQWSHDSLPMPRRLNTFITPSIDSGTSDVRYLPPPSPGLLSINSAWSELAYLHSRRSSALSADSFSSNRDSMSALSSSLSEHLRYLVRAFSSRTEKVKESTVRPPTPSSDSDIDEESIINSAILGSEDPRQQSFMPRSLRTSKASDSESSVDVYFMDIGCCKCYLPQWISRISFPSTFEPQSKIYISWLFLITFAFMYNAWVIPLRSVFPYQKPTNIVYWLVCDYICDFLYIVDIIVFKPRVRFLNNGLVETDGVQTRKNYMKKNMFKLDVLSLLPFDLLYLAVGFVPWLRIPRLLKIQTFWEFYSRCDQAMRSAHSVRYCKDIELVLTMLCNRIMKTMTYMMFLIHIETCGYYAMSVYEGINSNRWVYDGQGFAYIRCFYLATKTATSIGNNPKPTNVAEYMFMTIYWVSGVFVFALLIGQIRDIVEAANHIKSVYDQRMDAVMNFAKNVNLPKATQQKIRSWFVYQWQQHKTLDETGLMNCLPHNLRTDLAIHVHFNTLSKVKLFQDCDKNLLYDLVLKLKPVLYLPGDYVCKKGEVGKEMYIVSEGHVLVMGEERVLATLMEGSVFGEISLLAISVEGNRRTADVRCKGFTNLFILSKHDFEAAMSDYPEASKLLRKKARRLLKKNATVEKENSSIEKSSGYEEIIKSPQETPKMVQTVLQVMDQETNVMRQLTKSQMRLNCSSSMDRATSSEPPLEGHSTRLGPCSSDTPLDGHSTRLNSLTVSQDSQMSYPEVFVVPPNGLPTAQEVEDFYDEILVAHIPATIQEQSLQKLHPLSRDENLQTEQSDNSNDSGVQIKGQSSTESSTTATKTYSNKDSKESFMTDELEEITEETQSRTLSMEQLNCIHSEENSDPNDFKIATVIESDHKVPTCNGANAGGGCVPKRYQDTENRDPNMTVTKIGSISSYDDRAKRFSSSSIVDSDAQIFRPGLGSERNKNSDSSVQLINVSEIPQENKITCSVEVHREKSVTPTSIADLMNGQCSLPLCGRRDSTSSESSLLNNNCVCVRKESTVSEKSLTLNNTVVSDKKDSITSEKSLLINNFVIRDRKDSLSATDFTNLPLLNRRASIISMKSSSRVRDTSL